VAHLLIIKIQSVFKQKTICKLSFMMLSWPKGNYFPVVDMVTDRKQQRVVFLDWERS